MTTAHCPKCDDNFRSLKDKVSIYNSGMCVPCFRDTVRVVEMNTEKQYEKHSRYEVCETCGNVTLKGMKMCRQCEPVDEHTEKNHLKKTHMKMPWRKKRT